MKSRNYEKETLEILEWVKNLGLKPKDTIFVDVDRDKLIFAISNHFVNGIPHWTKGRNFIKYKERELQGGKVFEVVFNSTPAVAYMSLALTEADILTIIAHVYGHTHIFANNIFEYKDDNILEKLNYSLQVYDEMLSYYSYDELDVIYDYAYTAWNLLIPDEIRENKIENTTKEEFVENKTFNKFLGRKPKVEDFKEKYKKEKEIEFKKKYGIGSVYIHEYILEHSPIPDWMKTLINNEIDLLKVIMRKSKLKILHEGFASWVDTKYLLEKMEGKEFFSSLISSTLVGYPSLKNPYYIGYKLLEFAEKFMGKEVPEYVKYVDDFELIEEVFNEDFFYWLLKQFPLVEEEKKILSDRELFEEVFEDQKQRLLSECLNYYPIIYIDDYPDNIEEPSYDYLKVSSYSQNRKLKLTSKTPLDAKYAYETLKVLEKIWMGPIVLRCKLPHA